VFEEEEDPSNKSFFSEIISSISDLKFSRDGRFILSRDYLTLKIWDINMEKKPVQTINIHDHLRSKLCDLYENDCIFDKFECTFSGDGSYVTTFSFSLFVFFPSLSSDFAIFIYLFIYFFPLSRHVLSGSYHNYFHVYDCVNKTDTILQADKSAFKAKRVGSTKNKAANTKSKSKREEFSNVDTLDFTKKILHASWHPRENTIALAATNNLFLFQQT